MKKTKITETKVGKFVPFEANELLRSREVKHEYDQLQPEFAVIRAILDARLNQGITQSELANKLGTKQAVISRLETGKANPSINFIKRLAKVLDLDFSICLTARA